MKRVRSYTGYLIDIEGVLVRDKRYEPVAGSVGWYNNLAERGIASCLVSNNTTHLNREVRAMLNENGFQVAAGQLITVLDLAVDLLREKEHNTLLWLGHPRLREFWQQQGFSLVDDQQCDAVVLGLNPEIQLADLDRALPQLLEQGAELVALHHNPFYLDTDGRRRLGPGAWCAALERALGGRKSVCVGKPQARIYHKALKRVGVTADQALFISDDPLSDLRTARRLGMGTAFVLSGKYSDHAVLGQMDQKDWPDLICALPADLEAKESR